jgi:quinol monooxygenase YgiN
MPGAHAISPSDRHDGGAPMITEVAKITIDPVNAGAFEAAVAKAADVLRAAEGCRSMRLERVTEDPAQYRLMVEWDSVAHHMVTFRESEGFRQWRALAGPYFVTTPVVEHMEMVGRFF